MVCRKEKDPLKPKHPISAFLVYANERRAALREENKNVVEVYLKYFLSRSIFFAKC